MEKVKKISEKVSENSEKLNRFLRRNAAGQTSEKGSVANKIKKSSTVTPLVHLAHRLARINSASWDYDRPPLPDGETQSQRAYHPM